ncbi:hypothetical protein [Streptomyces zhihengii]|uniref:Uncharacterized protein n=1 Tax=Streptomyces zhihengii TaxID=1818004 RepID=A0ABS2V2I1_9ACTN|nr:hypothetical protein [Streptomyces zhihengii]MBM9624049.1 hypothetical protein [Streptomyces zhihengii]
MPAPPDDSTMGRVAAALSTLDHWHTMTWTDVAEAAGDAVHFLWEAWKGSAAFHALPPHDQAAIHHTLAMGRRVNCEPRSRLGPDYWQSHIEELRTEAHYAAALRHHPHNTPTLADRAQRATQAVSLHHRLLKLPPVWQHTILEQLTPRTPFAWHAVPPQAPPTLQEAVALAEAAASTGALPEPAQARRPTPDTSGQTLMDGLTRLPRGWQIETVRRIADGTAPMSALFNASQSINLVRSFGVYIAWNAPSAPRTARPEQ